MEKLETHKIRIRGRVGEGKDDKFYYEISLWTIDGKSELSSFPIGPFDTETEAREMGRGAVKIMLEAQGVTTVADMKDMAIKSLEKWRTKDEQNHN